MIMFELRLVYINAPTKKKTAKKVRLTSMAQEILNTLCTTDKSGNNPCAIYYNTYLVF